MFYSDSSPWIAGLIRGLALALVAAGIAFFANLGSSDGLPSFVVVGAPLVVLGLRSLEALVLDQSRSRDERMSPDL